MAYPLEEKISLGLDLQGGMHLVLEVQTEKAVDYGLEQKSDDIKNALEDEAVIAMAPPSEEGQQGGGSFLALLPPIIIMFLIFYFILIRPQQKKQAEVRNMLNDLKEGDNVVTLSGIHGTKFLGG